MKTPAGPREARDEGRFVRPARGFKPAYLRLHEEGRLKDRAAAALELLGPSCRVCPRRCRGVDRRSGAEATAAGFCGVGRFAQVSSAGAHMGEEDVLRGSRGSGTIFFTRCNLRCVFCQNDDISQGAPGEPASAEELAALMLRLQKAGCHNINLVTPSHVAPQIVEAAALAAEGGLRLPLVYNSGGFDALESLALLDGIVDVYMPDFKFWDPALGRKHLLAEDYPRVAREAIAEMHRQTGDLVVDEDGLALRGLLVRHLVMPGTGEDTAAILAWLAGLSKGTFVNVMGQYRPAARVPGGRAFAAIDRAVSREEVEAARAAAGRAGLWRLDGRWRPR